MNMTFRIRRTIGWHSVWWIPAVLWVGACASIPEGTPAAVILPVRPTLTPFQPSLDPTYTALAPAIETTFTPYPTRYVRPETLPVPVEIVPPSQAAALNIYNPLTGLPVSDPSFLQHRPLAIKIANSPDYVRPQSGLTLADVVFEYYIEWGDTRFIAIF